MPSERATCRPRNFSGLDEGVTSVESGLLSWAMSNEDRPLQNLPLLPLRHGVVLPGRVTTIPVGRPRSRALAESLRPGDHVLLGVQIDPLVDEPVFGDLHSIATVARVQEKTDRGGRGIILTIDALGRYSLQKLTQQNPFWIAEALPSEETGDAAECDALVASIKKLMKEVAPQDHAIHDQIEHAKTPTLIADRVASWLELDDLRKAEVLLETDVAKRLRLIVQLIGETRAKQDLRQKIDSEVRKEFGKNQKEAMLRQQMKVIQRELGDDGDSQADKLRENLEKADLPDEVRTVANRELRRLEAMGNGGPEANVIRTYLEWISELPWKIESPTAPDLQAIENKLEADHFGLADVKKRILEHMAVQRLGGKGKGTILALVGPPGVGKTSLAQSVADAIGRPLSRVSFGGVRDEAEIRGHRRTYVGAMPGRMMSALRKAKVNNPVMVLDEIDKMGRGWQGDPEAALLEVLDPEQNNSFTDHYMELPFDLSGIIFIATANDLSQLSAPLRDRLEIIELSGYITDEKVEIAKRHLVHQQEERTGLPQGSAKFSDSILNLVIHDYTRESGVRQLAREIGKICRAAALDVVKANDARVAAGETENAAVEVVVDETRVRKVLGKAKFLPESREATLKPGIATGLAWTPVGGDILFVETTRMPGKGHVEITGQLGDVMKESAKAALSYLRSHHEEYGIDPNITDKHDLHIHVPAGGVPKDGPSAGVTMFTALASLLTGRRVRADVAMTGEATLRGRVLPIGGVKAKVLAAHRAGYKRIILPRQNGRDLDELPENIREELEFVLADDMRDVLQAALEPDVIEQVAPIVSENTQPVRKPGVSA